MALSEIKVVLSGIVHVRLLRSDYQLYVCKFTCSLKRIHDPKPVLGALEVLGGHAHALPSACLLVLSFS